MAIQVFLSSIRNYFTSLPLCVSFEVTHSCNADCQHCDKGGIKKEEILLSPADYSDLIRRLRPPFIQISGGEPLLREDVVDIVRAIKQKNGLPYIIFVTNGALLNAKKYKALKEAGVDRFSVSLDFPNAKHDEFRRHKGLYAHLSETIPNLASDFPYNDIALNSAITRVNLPYLVQLANKAKEWGVPISYSAYCSLRTGSDDFFISSKEELEMLRQTIQELIQLKRKGDHILNFSTVLLRTYEFFRNGHIPNCNAGRRFLVVRPDGLLNPCSMKPDKQYSTQTEMIEDFTKHNQCGECYVAIRAYSDMPFWDLIKEYLPYFTE
jgi:MoaA/NifB/PqqE/SkfB family radical SAM enzyme